MFQTKYYKTSFTLFLCMFLLFVTQLAWAKTTRASLLLGDSSLRQSSSVIKDIYSEFDLITDTDIRIYSSTKLNEQDLSHLRQSDLIIIQTIGRNLINRVQLDLQQAMNNGAKVYAFGTSINETDKNAGIIEDPQVQQYFVNAGANNIRNGLLYALNQIGVNLPYQPPETVPEIGLYHAGTGTIYADFDRFKQDYHQYKPGKPWVGFVVYQSNIIAGSTSHIDAVINALENRDLNVMTVFGYPAQLPIERYFFDDQGHSSRSHYCCKHKNWRHSRDPDTIISTPQCPGDKCYFTVFNINRGLGGFIGWDGYYRTLLAISHAGNGRVNTTYRICC